MVTGGLYALKCDLLRDLEPIIQIGSEPLLFVGRKSLPADDLKGLIAYLKASPDKASVGIAGVGATGHLTGISFQKKPEPGFNSCRIAATPRLCRTCWRSRSIS